MANLSQSSPVTDFLAQKRVAVLGVAHVGQNTATGILRRFVKAGYQAFGVNPQGGTADGAPLYAHVQDIPGGVDAAVVVTSPAHALEAVQDCERAQVHRVWMHDNTLLPGSASTEAVDYCNAHGIRVIDKGCPMMHLQPDGAHRCMHWVLRKVGRLSE